MSKIAADYEMNLYLAGLDFVSMFIITTISRLVVVVGVVRIRYSYSNVAIKSHKYTETNFIRVVHIRQQQKR